MNLFEEVCKILQNLYTLSVALEGEKSVTLPLTIIIGFNTLIDKMEAALRELKQKSQPLSGLEQQVVNAYQVSLSKLLKYYSKTN